MSQNHHSIVLFDEIAPGICAIALILESILEIKSVS